MSLVDDLHDAVARTRSAEARRAESEGRQWGDVDDQLVTRAAVRRELDRLAAQRVALGEPPLADEERDELAEQVLDRALDGGRLLRVWRDNPAALNLIAQGPHRVLLELPDGSRRPGPPLADDEAELMAQLRALARHAGAKEREWHAGSPELDLRLPDGSRLTAVAWVTPFVFVALRRHTLPVVDLDGLCQRGTIPPELGLFLADAVRAGCNIVVGGEMNSGKTVLVRALVAALDADEHVITVESEFELAFHEHPDHYPPTTPMEALPPNIEGAGEVAQAELVTMTQRMSPTRLVVGEIRGSEILTLLKALSQGTRCLSTIHANTSADVLAKMASYAEEHGAASFEGALRRAAQTVDLVVQMRRLSDGQRVIESVREIQGLADGVVVSNEVFAPGPDGRAMPADPPSHGLVRRLETASARSRVEH